MTDLSRGARVRRGGRRPGWLLLTALLVLAIGASSALVFTNQVKLLKLAVILALWAAVVAAFVSVIYRRQSDVDQARARDLKLVYDLQLDREISARREYELTVESQLRRELSTELRAQDTDEVAALRAELAALRTNLEILFDAELSERPALETERKTVRGYSEWDREGESARERVNRVASVRPEEPSRRADDRSIIDVHEEPLVPAPPRQRTGDSYQPVYGYQPAEAYAPPRPPRATEVTHQVSEQDRGAHWPQSGQEARAARDEVAAPGGRPGPGVPPAAASSGPNTAERQPDSRGWAAQDRPSQTEGRAATGARAAEPAGEPERFEPPHPRRSHRRAEPPPPPEPHFVPPPVPPPQQQRPGWAPPPEAPRRQEQSAWQPVRSEGEWLPAGAPGSQWNSGQGDSAGTVSWGHDNATPPSQRAQRSPSAGDPVPASAPPVERRGRHSSAMAESAPNQIGEPAAEWSEPGRRARARHSTEYPDLGVAGSETPAPAMSPPPTPPPPPPPSPPDRGPVMTPPPPPNARHRGTDPLSATDHPPTGGQSVAELLARLQTTPAEGGRRRRRED
jgi:hypothetical protein